MLKTGSLIFEGKRNISQHKKFCGAGVEKRQ